MIEQKTVLIVGAGASYEFGLPVGAELKAKIADALAPDRSGGFFDVSLQNKDLSKGISRYSSANSVPISELVDAAAAMAAAMPLALSIDNYLDAHRTNSAAVAVGKMAIQTCIMEAEHGSKIYTRKSSIIGTMRTTDIASTWLVQIFQAITEGVQWQDLPASLSNLAIICFNYDRCIEFALPQLIATYYNRSLHEAKDVCSILGIHHPYGSLGELPGRNSPSENFGASSGNYDVVAGVERIRTFTEFQNVDKAASESVWATMVEAKRIIFLGFAYHKMNMRLLTPPDEPIRADIILGTTLGLSQVAAKAVDEDVRGWVEDRRTSVLSLQPVTCAELLRENFLLVRD